MTFDWSANAAAGAADLVRGYEHVKLRNVRTYHRFLSELSLPDSVPAFPIDVNTLPPEAGTPTPADVQIEVL